MERQCHDPSSINVVTRLNTLQASQALVVLVALRPCWPSEIRRRFHAGEVLDSGTVLGAGRDVLSAEDDWLPSFQGPYIASKTAVQMDFPRQQWTRTGQVCGF